MDEPRQGDPMIQAVAFGSALYRSAVAFRDEHLRRPLGLATSAADLDGEGAQIHIVASDGDAVVGTVVLKPATGARVKLRQMAVDPDRRGTGLGRRLVRFAEAAAAARGFLDIEMSARVSARLFYEGLGYRAVGDEFLEVTVPHVTMVKRLDA